jgi:hypothetical protein
MLSEKASICFVKSYYSWYILYVLSLSFARHEILKLIIDSKSYAYCWIIRLLWNTRRLKECICNFKFPDRNSSKKNWEVFEWMFSLKGLADGLVYYRKYAIKIVPLFFFSLCSNKFSTQDANCNK